MSMRVTLPRWTRFRNAVWRLMPALLPVARGARRRLWRLMGRRRVFEAIHRTNAWGSNNSVSGRGSDFEQTAAVRAVLPGLLDQLAVGSVLDAPCGDFHWMRHVDLSGRQYVGIDIVPALIQANRSNFGSAQRRFETCDLVHDLLPACELVLCRDCLVHLPFSDGLAALRNFRTSGARYLLTTTFQHRDANVDIAPGEWRPLNLEKPPFNFPAPILAIDERNTENEGIYADKRLALWSFDQLRQSLG